MTATKVETREDEEQGHKFNETIQLLLAAGYFRARIKGLSPFDKVVGGMTWCISTCDFDIDVDLLFQENSTIGQKIALTEKIVAVLPKMKCPHRIEPHQIQGLDFIHIFPVIQWLVKRAIETREEMGDKIRAYSISQFNKSYTSPQDELFIARKDHSIKTLQTVNEAYKPKRVYKKPEKYARADEETQVYTTLLEYGQNFTCSSLKKSEKQTKEAEKESEMAAGLVKVEDEVNAEKEEKRMTSLIEGMSQTDIQQMLSSRAVGSIVGLQVSQITEMVQEYTQRTQEHEQSTHEMKTSGSGINAHNRHVQTVQKQIEEQRAKVKEAEQHLQEITDASQQLKVSYKEKVDYSQRLIEETEKLEQTEADEINKSILTKLRFLVALNEKLKKQEHEFKAQCKIEVKELEAKLAAAQGEVSEENNSEAEKLRLISEQNDKDNEKLKKIRLLLAKRNREIASLQWKIDDVPSRAELSQYQKRFIELYNQVASTHKETKQFYTLFNTLDDTKLYLEKEVGLLNSIHDNFETASSQSAASKEEFLTQLENIVKGVKNNQDKVDKRRALEKSKKDEINAQHMQAVEKQRLYVKTVKEFQEECKKSEITQSKLRAAGIKA